MACPHHKQQAHVTLHDECLETFANDLTHLQPSSVTFDLEKDPTDIKGLKETLSAVATRECKVNLQLQHHWQRPTNGASDDFLAILVQPDAKCQVIVFSGCLSGQLVSLLPATVKELRLAITGEDQHMQAALAELTNRMTELRYLYLHVVAGTPLSVLHEVIGRSYGPHLLLSGVADDQVGWACDAARALQPRNSWWKYWTLRLTSSSLSGDGCMQLLRGLKERDVTVWECDSGVLVSSTTLNANRIHQIRNLANELLQCSFECVNSTSQIWPGKSFGNFCFVSIDEEEVDLEPSSDEEMVH